ncbi:MAG: hypothetical protein HUJ51_04530 [Eggerthellaceae bacterium]|nr:hypothetical protein [Eggerthellaceae bacterium]
MSAVANVVCGVTNVLLGFVFVVGFGWGLNAAVLATHRLCTLYSFWRRLFYGR